MYQGETIASTIAAPGISSIRRRSVQRRSIVHHTAMTIAGIAIAMGPLVSAPKPIATLYMASSQRRR